MNEFVEQFLLESRELVAQATDDLMALEEKPGDRDNPLRLIVTLLSPEMHVRFEERFDLKGVPSYSLTEDILSVIGPQNMPREKLGSCGVLLAPEVHRIAIHNEAGEPLAPGTLSSGATAPQCLRRASHPAQRSAVILRFSCYSA